MQMNQQHFRDLSKKLQYHSNKKSLKEKSIKKRINSQEIQKNSNYFIVQSNKINNLTQSNQTSSVYDLTLRKKYKVNLQERNQASQSQLQNLNSHQNHLIDDDQMKTEISNDNQSIAQYFETDQDQLPITILEIRPLTETKIKEKTKSLKQTFKSLLLLIQIFLKLFLLIFNKLKNITQMVFVYFKKKNKINTIKKDELFNELQYYKLPEEGIILENTEQIQSIQNKDPLICQKLKGDLKEIEQFQFENNWWDKSFFFEINQNIPKEPFELNEREFNSIFDKLKEKNYYLLKYLAKGGEGLVFNGYKLTEGKYVSLAFKIYQSKDGISYQSEVDMMKLFEKTINVVQIFDFINISENISIFVLELCHKSLHDELKKNKKDFTLMKLFKIIFDLIDGLIELQIYNILHLDIKPSNILINNQGNYVYADFGLSVLKKKDEKIKCKGYTKDFSPKELINTSENSLVGYKTDVFSCGETIKCIIKVFNEYSDSTFCKEISDEIFKIANENMINVEIEKRLNCFDLHKKFIDLLIDADLISFMHLYLEKIPKILKLSPYDKNKNSNFFLGTELYFHQVILKIKKQKVYSNLKENNQIFSHLSKISSFNSHFFKDTHQKQPKRYNNSKKVCDHLLIYQKNHKQKLPYKKQFPFQIHKKLKS